MNGLLSSAFADPRLHAVLITMFVAFAGDLMLSRTVRRRILSLIWKHRFVAVFIVIVCSVLFSTMR